MSNAIRFLEQLGRHDTLTGQLDLRQLAADYGVADNVVDALVAGDSTALSSLLGGRPAMICALFPAEPEPEQTPSENEPAEPSEQSPESLSIRSLH